jgi:antitoxin VapB
MEAAMNMHASEPNRRTVRLFRNGRSQAVRIPKEWEFEGEVVEIRQLPDGRLLVATAQTAGLVDYLKTAEPWTGGEFIEGDAVLPPLDEVRFG